MEENNLRDLESMFAQVEDPRPERSKLHRLRDIIILAICGVLCGAARVGIHAKRLKAGWDNQYLLRVLDGVNEM